MPERSFCCADYVMGRFSPFVWGSELGSLCHQPDVDVATVDESHSVFYKARSCSRVRAFLEGDPHID